MRIVIKPTLLNRYNRWELLAVLLGFVLLGSLLLPTFVFYLTIMLFCDTCSGYFFVVFRGNDDVSTRFLRK